MKYTGNSTENIIERKIKSYRNTKTNKELLFKVTTYISTFEKPEESDKFSEHILKVEVTNNENPFEDVISIYHMFNKCEYFTKTKHKILDNVLYLVSRDKKYKKWVTETMELAE